jgi:hypothetical protein
VSRVSSVIIVSGYSLDDRAIEVRSPAGAKDFSSNLCVQTGSGAHPASCTVGTGGSFPWGKARPERDADHSPPSSAEVMNELELYFLSPQASPWRVVGLLYFLHSWISVCPRVRQPSVKWSTIAESLRNSSIDTNISTLKMEYVSVKCYPSTCLLIVNPEQQHC